MIAASKSEDLIILALKSPVSDYEEVELLKRGEKGIEEWKQKGWIKCEKSDGTPLKLKYSFFEDIKNNPHKSLLDIIKQKTDESK